MAFPRARPIHLLHAILLGTCLPALARPELQVESGARYIHPFEWIHVWVSGDPDGSAYEWRVTPPDAGRFTRADRRGRENVFMAAPGAPPVRIVLEARRAGSAAGPWLAHRMYLQAPPFTIGHLERKAEKPETGELHLVSGETRRLLVSGGAPGATYAWTVQGPQGGLLRSRRGPRNVYRAPEVLETRTFRIAVEDTRDGRTAYLAVTVRPGPWKGPVSALLDPNNGVGLMGRVLGPDWDLPSMTLVGAPSTGPGAPYQPWTGVRSACFVEGPLPDHPEGRWLVADGTGLFWLDRDGARSRMNIHGIATPDEPETDLAHCTVQLLATRPEGSGERVPRIVAVLGRKEETVSAEGYLQATRQYLCALDPDGTVRPLAGRRFAPGDLNPSAPPEGLVQYTGPARQVDFRDVKALCLDRAGNIFVLDGSTWGAPDAGPFQVVHHADRGGIRRISPEGMVTAVFQPRPGHWGMGEMILSGASGLALDPDTSTLYVRIPDSVLSVGQDGALAPMAGYAEGAPSVAPPSVHGLKRFQFIHGSGPAAWHQGRLYFTEWRGGDRIWAFDPVDLRLQALAGPMPFGTVPGHGYHSRPGLLGLYAPDSAWIERAVFNGPRILALHGAQALVAMDDGLALLHLGPDPFGGLMSLPSRREAEAPEEKEPAPAAPLHRPATGHGPARP